jgi:hypothetical protein
MEDKNRLGTKPYTLGSIFQEIKSLHPDLTEGTKGWWRCNPDSSHNDKSLCFNFESFWVNDYRSGLSCSIVTYLRQAGVDVDYSELHRNHLVQKPRRPAKLDMTLPEGFKLIGTANEYLNQRVEHYVIEKRNIPLNVAQEALLGFVSDRTSKWFGYIIFPNIALGRLEYLSGRAFLGGYDKHKNESFDAYNRGSADTLYNRNAIYRMHKELFLLEGCFDVLTMYPNAVGLYKWKVSPEQLQLLLKYDGVFVIAPDRGFETKAKELAVLLMRHRKKVKLLRLPYEGTQKDVNDLGAETVRYIADNTQLLTFNTL